MEGGGYSDCNFKNMYLSVSVSGSEVVVAVSVTVSVVSVSVDSVSVVSELACVIVRSRGV